MRLSPAARLCDAGADMGHHCCAHKMEDLLARLEAACRAGGQRVTAPRRRVLEAVARAAEPVGAYAVLEVLPDLHPPTVYRALEFLEGAGLLHRVASRSAYMVCGAARAHAGTQFLICDVCGHVEVAPAPALPAALVAQAEGAGFAPTRWATELHGTCAACRGGKTDA
ncbi:MAG: transcriptional repressor [Alphaproteobacteria bacterium]|jgi:Fur family zinc uptake transcriptional regulator|nr:transcriptional repressor [Alphaproteobacteria bacterium]